MSRKFILKKCLYFLSALTRDILPPKKHKAGLLSQAKSDIVSPIEVPELLGKLITKNDERSKHYLSNIRSYLY